MVKNEYFSKILWPTGRELPLLCLYALKKHNYINDFFALKKLLFFFLSGYKRQKCKNIETQFSRSRIKIEY